MASYPKLLNSSILCKMGYYSFLFTDSSDSEGQNSFTDPLMPPNRLIEESKVIMKRKKLRESFVKKNAVSFKKK